MPTRTVRKNWCFYWDTRLSDARLEQIDQWVGTLTEDQKKMLKELVSDAQEEALYDERESQACAGNW